jgi:hypothetical protein
MAGKIIAILQVREFIFLIKWGLKGGFMNWPCPKKSSFSKHNSFPTFKCHLMDVSFFLISQFYLLNFTCESEKNYDPNKVENWNRGRR